MKLTDEQRKRIATDLAAILGDHGEEPTVLSACRAQAIIDAILEVSAAARADDNEARDDQANELSWMIEAAKEVAHKWDRRPTTFELAAIIKRHYDARETRDAQLEFYMAQLDRKHAELEAKDAEIERLKANLDSGSRQDGATRIGSGTS